MKIPHTVIDPDTLSRMIEELVTRDGTDYGISEMTLEQKVAQVKRQLQSGDAQILYDESLALCEIVKVEK